jgi:hypothetical protein
LQGFSNEETSKSEFFDMVCAVRNFENANEEALENGWSVMHLKWASTT